MTHSDNDKQKNIAENRPLPTPVLLIIFNRPDTTQEVFAAIRKARPTQLFVQADGPRVGNASDAELCRRAREIVKRVDWQCDVQHYFSEANMGCRTNVFSGIAWFFENVEEGIILEDDCLASQSFFWFCHQLLEKYRDDERIMQIEGNNYLFGKKTFRSSYYFSKLNDISGWATWKRAWKHFDPDMKGFDEFDRKGCINDYVPDRRIARWMMSYMREAYESLGGTWSPAWVYALCKQNGLTIVPSINLVFHMGYGRQDSTFSTGDTWDIYNQVKACEMEKIIHPQSVIHDVEADRIRFDVIRKVDPRLILSERLKSWCKWKIVEPMRRLAGRVSWVFHRLFGR